MVPVKAIPQKPFQTTFHFIALFLSLYIYLGFVKFSIIQKKDSFRILVFVAMTLSVIQSAIVIIATLTDNKEIYYYNGVLIAAETLLLYYGFKLVQDVKIKYFKKLSRVYLYLSAFFIPTAVIMLFGRETVKMLPNILIKPLVLLALLWAALMVYAWYLKIRTFKQIATLMY
jgi:hypothetical protein